MGCGSSALQAENNSWKPGAFKPVGERGRAAINGKFPAGLPEANKAPTTAVRPSGSAGAGPNAASGFLMAAAAAAAAAAPPPCAKDLLAHEPRAPKGVEERGVTLRHLQQLVASGAVNPDWTLREMVDNYVRPSTQNFPGCCLFDMVPMHATGRPKYFVSHPGCGTVGEALRILSKHLEGEASGGPPGPNLGPDCLLWMDVFATDQNVANFEEDLGGVRECNSSLLSRVIGVTEATLLIFEREYAALTSMRCLYSIWLATKKSEAKGVRVLAEDPIDTARLAALLKGIDVLHAHASRREEQNRMVDAMTEDLSIQKLHAQLRGSIMDCVVYETLHTKAVGAAKAAIQSKGAQILVAYGRVKQAEGLYRDAWETRKREFGPKHASTLASAAALAACVFDMGRYAEAEPLLKEVVDARERELGDDHPDTVQTTKALAQAIEKQPGNRLGEAETLYRQAHTNALESDDLGPDHPDTLAIGDALADNLRAQGKKGEAEACFWQILECKTRVLGPEHPSTVTTVDSLATCISEQGRHAEAELMCRQAVEAKSHVLGPDHPDTLASRTNLAMCINNQGRRKEAETEYRTIWDAFLCKFGPEHADTIKATTSLANCVFGLGRKTEAEPLYRMAADNAKKALGTSHVDTMAAVLALAHCIHAQGRYKEAEPHFSSVADARSRVLGKDHPDTIAANFAWAVCKDRIGNSDEAETMLRDCMEASTRVNGPRSAKTGDIIYKLAELLAGDFELLSTAPGGNRKNEAKDMYNVAAEVYAHVFGVEDPRVKEAAQRAYLLTCSL